MPQAANYSTPVYVVDGREFKTPHGLMKHLVKKHAAREMSGVSSDRKVRVYRGRDEVVATYAVEPPVFGKPMHLTLLADPL